MKNFFTKKRRLFPDWLEKKFTKKIFIVILIIITLYFLVGSLQTIFEQKRCENRAYVWFSIPPIGKVGLYNLTRDSVYEQTKYVYREIYMWGVCADTNKK
ncbi:MAG: hypothetical protein WCO12_01960 [bacterium]